MPEQVTAGLVSCFPAVQSAWFLGEATRFLVLGALVRDWLNFDPCGVKSRSDILGKFNYFRIGVGFR